ncbi:MAG: hypothetical protein ACREGR_00395 [Minisyncoccia bacterium]
MTGAKRTEDGYEYRGYRIECDRSVGKGYYGRWVVSSPSGIKRLFACETLRDAKVKVDQRVTYLEGVKMDNARQANADQAFELYDMGDMVVEDTSGWERVLGSDEMSRSVFVADEVDADGYGVSKKLTFVVRFVPGSAEVSEAYFAG